ncbi:MAG: hypothetical protein LC677_11395 [Halomonas sp.]|nr:hypothetical protein [Halomonas sp.]
MVDVRIFLKVDVLAWVEGTIAKVKFGEEWNSAWQRTYSEIGGTSQETGRKSCPMVAARTLYELGRILNNGLPSKAILSEVCEKHSKNGAYAIAAIDCLNRNPALTPTALWSQVQDRIRDDLGVEPAASNQGGATLTYKLWHLGVVQ